MYHRNLVLFSVLLSYYVISLWTLMTFDAGLLVTAVVLYGVPSVALAHFSVAPLAMVLSVGTLGAGLAFILEGAAHLFGLWYSLGISELRVAGLVPLEMVVATTLQVLFFALLYEVLFDDGIYTKTSLKTRFTAFLVFLVSAIGLVLLHTVLLWGWYVEYAFVWLVAIFVAAAFAALMLYRKATVLLLDRLVDFAFIAVVPSGIGLWLAVHNVHKVYALTDGYIGEVLIFGQMLPVEEILLLFTLPFLTALLYELYLDDRA